MKRLPLLEQTTQQPSIQEQNGEGKHGFFKQFPKPSPKQGIYLAIAIATALLLVWAFRPAPIMVDTAKVERGALQVSVDAEGKTRVHDRFLITAPVNGHLERIDLREGDLVKLGALVARIEPLPLTASVREALGRLAEWKAQRTGVETQRPKPETLAQSSARIQKAIEDQRQAASKVAQARADLEQAKRDRHRAEQLAASGVISRKDRESAELNETTKTKDLEGTMLAAASASADVEVAKAALSVLQREQTDPDYLLKVYDARISSTEAELDKLRDDATRTEIRSPVQGKVLRILQTSAQFVTEGTSILELANVANLELVIDVLSTDAERIKPGDAILLERLDAPPLRAKVRLVEPSAFTKVSALGVEEQRVNVIGDFVDLPQSLGDAYRVEAKIIVWEGKDVVKLPLSALFRCEQKWCVFTVQNNRAQRRAVEVLHRNNLEAEIQKGINAGEIVILHPNEQIHDGKEINLRK